MKHHNPNMLVRIAQADAYAMAVEYVKPREHPQLFADALSFDRYLQHPTHSLKPGMYTDDTQMSIAVAETLLEHDVDKLTKEHFAESFFRCFKRDQRDGYSRGFQKILETSSSWQDMVSKLNADSDKNGAAMRAVPIGVLKDPKDVVRVAKMQAQVTHDTPGGRDSAVLIALQSHYSLYEDGDFEDFRDWGEMHFWTPSTWRRKWHGGVGLKNTDLYRAGIGMCTAHAVDTLLQQEKSLMSIMQQVIEWGGDTDSVAAIAWGIASSRHQDEILPEFFDWGLETGRKYGLAFLRHLGEKLMGRYA